MSEEVGTTELKELLAFVITLGESLESAMADGKFEIAELALLMPALMKVGDAFTGLDKLGGEIKDLDEAEMADLVAFVKTDLDLANDNVENVIENALGLAVKIYAFVQLFKKDEAEATA